MIAIPAPALYCGLLLASAAVIVGWALRRSSAPILAKVLAPAALASVAIAAPWLINSMQGTAKTTTFEALAHCINIAAVVPDDASKSATMLISENGGLVAYQIVIDDRIRDGLKEVIDALNRGDPAVLCKEDKKLGAAAAGYTNKDTTGKMHIDSSLFLKNLKGRS